MTAVLEKTARSPATHAGATPALSGKKNSGVQAEKMVRPKTRKTSYGFAALPQAGKNKKMKSASMSRQKEGKKSSKCSKCSEIRVHVM